MVLKGDLPIGVDKRSVDTWRAPHLFRMDKSTGAPPDAFSPTGKARGATRGRGRGPGHGGGRVGGDGHGSGSRGGGGGGNGGMRAGAEEEEERRRGQRMRGRPASPPSHPHPNRRTHTHNSPPHTHIHKHHTHARDPTNHPHPHPPAGQNWGFPTYDWSAMSADGFAWWRSRLSHLAQYFTAYRIDHVLGFFRIWEVPGDCVTGENTGSGWWGGGEAGRVCRYQPKVNRPSGAGEGGWVLGLSSPFQRQEDA